MKRPLQKKIVLLFLAGLLALPLAGCKGGPKDKGPGGSDAAVEVKPRKQLDTRVIMLGFDGVDPDLIEKWETDLPNITRLRKQWNYYRLGSTIPPHSPVAWTTFATGTGPGRHGVFDFLSRDPMTYLPDISYLKLEKPIFDENNRLVSPPKAMALKKKKAFWNLLGREGVKSVLLSVPYASFPPEDTPHTVILSGLGVPDLLSTNSTFHYFGTEVTEAEARRNVGGGKLYRLAFADGRALAEVEGPVDATQTGYHRLTSPVEFTQETDRRAVTVFFQGKKQTIPEGTWGDWLEIKYDFTDHYGAEGICRFHVISAGDPVRIYLTPLMFHPKKPYIPFSGPENFSGDLMDKWGYYKTLGWVHDTSALNSEKIDEALFLDEMETNISFREKTTLDQLSGGDFDLFVSVFTATDRVAHMFYRLMDKKNPLYDPKLAAMYGNAIKRIYAEMDRIVGEALAYADERTVFMVMSDHGFHPFRRGLNLNTWLVQNGYMTLKGDRQSTDKEFFMDTDWSRTRAYALGIAHIYLNLKGREARGTVTPGPEYDALVDEMAGKLSQLVDPATGERVIRNVYKGREVYGTESRERMPDLVLGMTSGYRTTWETPLGGIPGELFTDNLKKWSGDHGASDVKDTHGILIINRKLAVDDPSILDLPFTIMNLLDVPPPAYMEGRNLLP